MIDQTCYLIVYSSFGDGHLQAAKAIRQSLAARGARRVHLIDLLAEAHPYWNAFSRFTYLQSSIHFPRLYGFSYDITNNVKPDPHWSRLFHSIGKRKLKEIVEHLRPDAVIHTFPYLAMPELAGRSGSGIPTFTVLTDYVLHSRWVHPGTDRYFVATEQLKRSLAAAGIPDKRIAVSGIPIREAFAQPVSKAALHAKLGLDPGKKYVLLAAGAYGVLSDVHKMVETVQEHTDYEILLICGKNRKLLAKMQEAYGSIARIKVMGYVEQMEEWMAVSSCLLTKAGGITLTEAMSMSLPVIVYRPLPGQEKGNAVVLSEQGAICTANDTDELALQLRRLEEQPARRQMLQAMKAVYRPQAAQVIVSDVIAMVRQFRSTTADLSKHTAHPDALQWRTN